MVFPITAITRSRAITAIVDATEILCRRVTACSIQQSWWRGCGLLPSLFPVPCPVLKALREFRTGRPQIIAGLMLLAFLAQSLWVAAGRKFSDLEYNYMASGFRPAAEQKLNSPSPLTGLVAALPLRSISGLRKILPESMKSALGVPRTWLIRLPFIIFGLWLGGALWWVARRLYGDPGGYVALALYCFSPAMVMITSNIGPEIILAWSSFGLIYT